MRIGEQHVLRRELLGCVLQLDQSHAIGGSTADAIDLACDAFAELCLVDERSDAAVGRLAPGLAAPEEGVLQGIYRVKRQ